MNDCFFYYLNLTIQYRAMLNKKIIKLCHGSSCFSRGNKELVGVIQQFIRSNNIEDKVAFSGDHCFEICSEGPNIRINGKLFQHISLENIKDILKNELSDIL
jgi:NADH:ubiquinone oxidoreductase subunit E